MAQSKWTFFKWILPIFFMFGLVGCATDKFPPSHPQDPYEHFNRKVFAFNMALDRAFFRPIAKVYDAVLPWPVKKGVRNFFGNLNDLTSVANELLQMHFAQAVADLARIVINTTIGIGGLFDVATYLGLEKDKEDFGLTLASWGSTATPYIILPFLGPYTLRDFVGMPVDYFLFGVWPYIPWDSLRYGLQGISLVQYRASLLAGDEIVDQAFDPYVFIRDAYLQRRAYLVKENKENHITKYADEHGIVHRRHRSIPANSVLSN